MSHRILQFFACAVLTLTPFLPARADDSSSYEWTSDSDARTHCPAVSKHDRSYCESISNSDKRNYCRRVADNDRSAVPHVA